MVSWLPRTRTGARAGTRETPARASQLGTPPPLQTRGCGVAEKTAESTGGGSSLITSGETAGRRPQQQRLSVRSELLRGLRARGSPTWQPALGCRVHGGRKLSMRHVLVSPMRERVPDHGVDALQQQASAGSYRWGVALSPSGRAEPGRGRVRGVGVRRVAGPRCSGARPRMVAWLSTCRAVSWCACVARASCPAGAPAAHCIMNRRWCPTEQKP